MPRRISIVAIIWLFIITIPNFGQIRNFGVEKLTTNEGLAHNTVECIFKDSEGFVWIGTQYGLNQFNGYSLKTFRKNYNDSTTISGNRISAIVEDAYGNLWIGTSHGLNLFHRDVEKFTRYYEKNEIGKLASDNITTLKNIEGKLWVGTDKGLFLYDEEKDIFIPYLPEREDSTFRNLLIYDVIKTQEGKILISSDNNCIHELNPETKSFSPIYYQRAKGLKRNYRKNMIEDSNGYIWISAYQHGLVKLNITTLESQNYNTRNSNIQTDLLNGRLIIDHDMIWLTTDGRGIGVYNLQTDSFNSFDQLYPLLSEKIDDKFYSVYKDNEGIIWLGSFNNGVTMLNPNSQKFENTCINYELSHFYGQSVLAMYEDTTQTLWIGTDGNGLFALDGKIIKHYIQDVSNTNTINSNRIVSINEDANGNIIAGAYNGGLNVINPNTAEIKTFAPNHPVNSISGPHVWSICKESDTKIWLGFLGEGVNLYNSINQTFIDYGPSTDNFNRVNHGKIHCIMTDSDGDVWFGTEGAGVNILDKETRTMFYSLPAPNVNALQQNEVYSIYQDKSGIIWLATDDGGLYRYSKPDRILTHISLTDVTNNNMVQSIIVGRRHELWLGLNRGLIRLDTDSYTCTYYDIGEGLPGNICNRNSILKLNNGHILIGTTQGVVAFHPDSIKVNQFTPKPYLSGIKLDNTPINIGEKVNNRILLPKHINKTNALELNSKENIFTIEFGAFSYTLSDECHFQYILKGFERDWKTVDASQRFATYTNLAPGAYTFKLKASNNDGIYNNYIKSIDITVLPNFYQSNLFKVILGISLSIILYVVYRIAIYQKLKRQTEKQLIAENRVIQLEKENIEQKLNQQAFSIIQRNKSLLFVKKKLGFIGKRLDEKNRVAVQDLISHIDNELNEERDWKKIEPRLDSVYNNFLTHLQTNFPKLTQTELRLCAYIRMGLTTKEITEIMQKSLKAVENDRYRLRKKLEIPPENSLKSHLLNI